ncbi:MAG: alanine--tRNA ligase [Candidatus Lokiarchaeota archaeon]|nr:alanine--tRNA ligase [Candidatus Lokiarchaeota archaeon]
MSLDKELLKRKFGREKYEVKIFREKGFERLKCPICGDYYWTLNPDSKNCGDTLCVGGYKFLHSKKKGWDFHETIKNWCEFFEKNGHTRINEFPVVARWRDDLYYTIASITLFQKSVLQGATPPANPLVVPQPCIRFGGKGFNDIDNVGKTGRHLSSFIMGGQHSFNSEKLRKLDYNGYWMDRCIELDFKFITEEMNVPENEITLREDIWMGGGNFGPCLESFSKGLEIVNSVFMQYEILPDNSYKQMDMTVVDVGWGIERIGWFTLGTPTIYEATFGPVLEKMKSLSGIRINRDILSKYTILSGLLNIDEVDDVLTKRKKIAKKIGIEYIQMEKILGPLEALYSICDHLRTLVFTIADGAIPSNVSGGYNLRVILRRCFTLKDKYELENIDLLEILFDHLNYLKKTYPRVEDARETIKPIFEIEKARYYKTLSSGKKLVKSMIKKNQKLDIPKIIDLYQSKGIPPELIEEIAEEEDKEIEIPGNIYLLIDEQHEKNQQKAKSLELKEQLKEKVVGLPATDLLYYLDHNIFSFKAKIIKNIKNRFIVLDKTYFYPTGGGQLNDKGKIEKSRVKDVEKIGNVVVHVLKKPNDNLKKGDTVECEIDKERRLALVRHHTATHIINAAARKVLGKHVWQAGTEKTPDHARLDITHFKNLTLEEIWQIENWANKIVMENRPLSKKIYNRNEAEEKFGFRLYQGGVVPGDEIRIVSIDHWDDEACAGLHLDSTGEIGFIKIKNTRRIQDGIVRLEYVAGIPAVKYIHKQEKILKDTAKILSVADTELPQTSKRFFQEWKTLQKDKERLLETLADYMINELKQNSTTIEGIKFAIKEFDNKDIDDLITIADEIINEDSNFILELLAVNKSISVILMAGETAIKKGFHSGQVLNKLVKKFGGGAGGKKELGQGGGIKKGDLTDFKIYSRNYIKEILQKI